MSGEKKDSIVGQIFVGVVVAVVVALLAGGTAPWWWNHFFPNDKQLPESNNEESPSPVDSQTSPEPPLLPGDYSPENGGSLFNGSGRYIATVGNKICIATVNSQPSPYEGYSEISVSRLLWRNENFYINATDQPLIIHSNTSFSEGEVGRFTPLWSLSQTRINEPYQTLLNDCLQSSNNEYEFNKIDNFREGIPFYGSPQENPQADTPPSSGMLKVQNLPDGDYFFSTQQPPFDELSNILLLRKQGSTVIGWASEGHSGNCFIQVIKSSSEVETTSYDEGTRNTRIEDGGVGSSEHLQFNTSQYPDFDSRLRPCTEMFSN